MPAYSRGQQKLMGAELVRRRQGLKPRVSGLSTAKVRKFASTKHKGLPARSPSPVPYRKPTRSKSGGAFAGMKRRPMAKPGAVSRSGMRYSKRGLAV